MSVDRNDMAFWFPSLEACGVPVPQTRLVNTYVALEALLDGEDPAGWPGFVEELAAAAAAVGGGGPFFLRTGHGSGKHRWRETCRVDSADRDVLAHHVAALVEWSALQGILGLPTTTWAARELLDVKELFTCEGYGGMPVVREFRAFVRDDDVYHFQPYWPADAVHQGRPSVEDWRPRLREANTIHSCREASVVLGLARMAASAVRAQRPTGDCAWSVDLLQDAGGSWWVTDMAEAVRSFAWQPHYPVLAMDEP